MNTFKIIIQLTPLTRLNYNIKLSPAVWAESVTWQDCCQQIIRKMNMSIFSLSISPIPCHHIIWCCFLVSRFEYMHLHSQEKSISGSTAMMWRHINVCHFSGTITMLDVDTRHRANETKECSFVNCHLFTKNSLLWRARVKAARNTHTHTHAQAHVHAHAHTYTQSFYGSMDSVRDYPG